MAPQAARKVARFVLNLIVELTLGLLTASRGGRPGLTAGGCNSGVGNRQLAKGTRVRAGLDRTARNDFQHFTEEDAVLVVHFPLPKNRLFVLLTTHLVLAGPLETHGRRRLVVDRGPH